MVLAVHPNRVSFLFPVIILLLPASPVRNGSDSHTTVTFPWAATAAGTLLFTLKRNFSTSGTAGIPRSTARTAVISRASPGTGKCKIAERKLR